MASKIGAGAGPSLRKWKKLDTSKLKFELINLADSDSEEDDGQQEFDEKKQILLEEIRSTENKIHVLNERASEEILKIEQKFNKLKKLVFDKRNAITDKIDKFWITAMVNHPQISLLIEKDEEACLQFMTKLEVEESENSKSGYQIRFYFEPNPFFENGLLAKEFYLGPTRDHKSKSTDIMWKPGMDLCKKVIGDPTLKRKRGYVPRNFFSWFTDHDDPFGDEIANSIKDDLWLNPLQYYLILDIEGEDKLFEGSQDNEGEGVNEDAIDEVKEIDDGYSGSSGVDDYPVDDDEDNEQ